MLAFFWAGGELGDEAHDDASEGAACVAEAVVHVDFRDVQRRREVVVGGRVFVVQGLEDLQVDVFVLLGELCGELGLRELEHVPDPRPMEGAFGIEVGAEVVLVEGHVSRVSTALFGAASPRAVDDEAVEVAPDVRAELSAVGGEASQALLGDDLLEEALGEIVRELVVGPPAKADVRVNRLIVSAREELGRLLDVARRAPHERFDQRRRGAGESLAASRCAHLARAEYSLVLETIPDRKLSRLLEAVCDDTFAARIEVLEEAGRGGMGVVYRARNKADDSLVAVKELRPEHDVDLQRFLDEAEALEALEHPGIVRYHEHGAMRDGRHYLVIDWLDGDSLRERLRAGALEVAEAVALTRQVAEALAHAHAAGIVHRDLKPGNLMLTDGDTRVVLVDFGIAKRVDAKHETLTRTGQIVGTPGYFAPEQLTAGATIEGRTDVFALACVLHEMLTGERAFVGDDVVQLLVDVMTSEPPPIDRPHVPERLASLLQGMLQKNTDARPTAAQCAEELSAIAEAIDREDRQALSMTSPLAPLPATSKRGMPSWLVLAAGAAAVGAIAVVLAQRPEEAPRAALASPSSPSANSSPGSDRSPGSPPEPCDRDRRQGCAAGCRAGDGEACLRLGEALSHGTHGFARDRDAGLDHLRKACGLRVARGCLTASTILKLRDDGPSDVWAKDFEHLLERGCDLQLGNACRRLASHLHKGSLLKRDEGRARFLGERGCNFGDNHACRFAAEWYEAAGNGDKSRKLLATACERHDKIACKQLNESE